MRKITRREWKELTDAAWEWNPIGVPRNEHTTGEYACIVEQVVPLLQRGADAPQIVEHFSTYFPEHFGLLLPAGADDFAEKAVVWWEKVHR